MKKNNASALQLLPLPLFLGGIHFLTLKSGWFLYSCGQIAGGVFYAQCFILMHEFGHRSFFKSQKANLMGGYLASFFVFIPFYNWRKIHDLHHRWVGYRDKDPTTEKTFYERLSSKQIKIINFSWKFFIPVFTIGYRFGIYWKLEKLKRFLTKTEYERCVKEMLLYSGLYIALLFLFKKVCLLLLPALMLSFAFTEILSLSQHSHIQMKHSGNAEVEPLRFVDQAEYSRSLIFPKWFSKYWIFNFNYHEAHHAYPGLPCYLLSEIKVKSTNSYKFFPWVRKVKSLDGVNFIFKSSENRDGF